MKLTEIGVLEYESFSKDNLTMVTMEIQELLNQFGKKRNISFKLGNTSYDHGNFNTKITGTISNGRTAEQIQQDKLTLTKKHLGKSFVFESAGLKGSCPRQFTGIVIRDNGVYKIELLDNFTYLVVNANGEVVEQTSSKGSHFYGSVVDKIVKEIKS